MTTDIPPGVDRQLAKAYLYGVATGAVVGGALAHLTLVEEYVFRQLLLPVFTVLANMNISVFEVLFPVPPPALIATSIVATVVLFVLSLRQALRETPVATIGVPDRHPARFFLEAPPEDPEQSEADDP